VLCGVEDDVERGRKGRSSIEGAFRITECLGYLQIYSPFAKSSEILINNLERGLIIRE